MCASQQMMKLCFVIICCTAVLIIMSDSAVDNSASNIKQESSASSSVSSDIKTLPVRSYLDQTVVPLLLQGMSELVKVRPDQPVEWLATYLMNNNPNKKK
jgi:protein dpy-30